MRARARAVQSGITFRSPRLLLPAETGRQGTSGRAGRSLRCRNKGLRQDRSRCARMMASSATHRVCSSASRSAWPRPSSRTSMAVRPCCSLCCSEWPSISSRPNRASRRGWRCRRARFCGSASRCSVARITFEQIAGLGWQTMAGVACAVTLTILFGVVCAPLAGMQRRFGVLTAGAVAICGASAAAAIAAVLPRSLTHDRDTAFTIIGVTALSTLAMVLYPLIAVALPFHPCADRSVFGRHDPRRRAGRRRRLFRLAGERRRRHHHQAPARRAARAGGARDLASVAPHRHSRKRQAAGGGPAVSRRLRRHRLLNSVHLIPASVQTALGDASRWCIVVAIAALGIKTLVALGHVGPRASRSWWRRPFSSGFSSWSSFMSLRRFGPEPLTVARLHVF